MWRVTIKGLLAKKLRLVLTSIAVVLGVAFISGTFVLTDTLGSVFDNLFTETTKGIDAVVRTKRALDDDQPGKIVSQPRSRQSRGDRRARTWSAGRSRLRPGLRHRRRQGRRHGAEGQPADVRALVAAAAVRRGRTTSRRGTHRGAPTRSSSTRTRPTSRATGSATRCRSCSSRPRRRRSSWSASSGSATAAARQVRRRRLHARDGTARGRPEGPVGRDRRGRQAGCLGGTAGAAACARPSRQPTARTPTRS